MIGHVLAAALGLAGLGAAVWHTLTASGPGDW